MNAAWDRAFPNALHDAAGRRVPFSMKWGVQAMGTPPWAQDIGPFRDEAALCEAIEKTPAALTVLDLPAGTPAPQRLPGQTWAVQRHTRHIKLANQDPVEQWPATRRKQWRRAEREGLTASRSTDINQLVELHQAARHRKGIVSDRGQLRRLLKELMTEPTTHAWVVHNAKGDAICGGVFHAAHPGRCVYGFGGQFRSQHPGESSRATVLLIGTAMRYAAQEGTMTFDFGGSMDPGVDRFYAEFGAEAVPKIRLVKMAPWWKPIMRWRRPDLFDK